VWHGICIIASAGPKRVTSRRQVVPPERLLASKGLWRSRLRLLRRQDVSIHDYDQPYRLFRKKSNKRGKNTWQQ